MPDDASVRLARGGDEVDELLRAVLAALVERQDLAHVRDLAGAVGKARGADDDVHRARHLRPHRAHGQVDAGEEAERLEAPERVRGRVGVGGGERAAVAGVHRLQEVEALAATDFADDDAIGPQAQR